jgi:hypothetical protein
METDERLLTPEQREALSPQRPPERFAERVMDRVAGVRARRRRGPRAVAAAAALAFAAAACVALVTRRPPDHGDVRATARRDVRLGPRVVAVLERGAHVAWNGDEVTQDAGDVFYRFEPGGARHVHTPAGDVTVHGTCFDVKVRTAEEQASEMNKRDAVAGVVGAIASAAVLVGVYEGKVTLANAQASVELLSGQAARADGGGLHGPQDLAAAEQAFGASSSDEPWRAANANLADRVSFYQRRLAENELQKKAIEKDLKQLKAKVAAADRDGAAPRNLDDVDPRDLTQDELKELASKGAVRTRFFCVPPDWHMSPDLLDALGLAPGDAPAVERAVAATQQRMWQAVGPECVKIVGSAEVAQRLGPEMCGMIIQNAATKAGSDQDIQLVADVLAGNKPMPPPTQIDPLAARILTLAGESSGFEKDLAQDFGPEMAHRIARDDDSLGMGCGLNFQR